MTKDQKAVAIAAPAGVLFMILSVWILGQRLPVPHAPATADRLVYALKWDALPAALFLLMIVAVGNGRFLGLAIDPTLGNEGHRLKVNARVVDNTAQQLLLFVVASLAIAAQLEPGRLPLIGAAAITFVLVRLAFWVGYQIRPVHRAFGFAGTCSLNFAMLAAVLWLSLR